jgi:hypothetical protein
LVLALTPDPDVACGSMKQPTSVSRLVSLLVLMTAAAACSSSPAASDAGAGSGGSGGSTPGSGGAGTGGGSGGGSGSGGAGSGGSSAGGSGGAAPTDGPSSMDVAAEAPASDGGADAAGPAAALDKFLFAIPCPTATTAGSCNIPDAMRAKMTTLTFGGDPNITYKVTLHFCGPIEARPYMGCSSTQATYLCVDGTALTSGFNPTYPKYEIRVASPAHSYFLNNRDLKDDLMKIDYSATIDVKGGSSITYVSDGGSNLEAFTSTIMNHNYMCPGVPGITQPFAGQFIYTTVVSVNPS